MEKIILALLIVFAFSCKKKTDPEPEQSSAASTTGATPICQASDKGYVGVFTRYSSDTIRISVISNGCPIRGDSNVFLVKGIAEAMATIITDKNYTLTAHDYTMVTRKGSDIIDNNDPTRPFGFTPLANGYIKFFTAMPTVFGSSNTSTVNFTKR